jgi:hypothetical protein
VGHVVEEEAIVVVVVVATTVVEGVDMVTEMAEGIYFMLYYSFISKLLSNDEIHYKRSRFPLEFTRVGYLRTSELNNSYNTSLGI